jgi:hypothetical protein
MLCKGIPLHSIYTILTMHHKQQVIILKRCTHLNIVEKRHLAHQNQFYKEMNFVRACMLNYLGENHLLINSKFPFESSFVCSRKDCIRNTLSHLEKLLN